MKNFIYYTVVTPKEYKVTEDKQTAFDIFRNYIKNNEFDVYLVKNEITKRRKSKPRTIQTIILKGVVGQ